MSSEQSFTGDMMQIDLVVQFSSSMYPYALTGIDVFTKYLVAVAKALVSIFFQHSYIPETILTDLGTSFVANLIHELSRSLHIKLKHASLKYKYPQTIGVVERAHDSFKRIIMIHINETWSNWHRYPNLATFIHNTSYHSSIGTTPSTNFYGREPTKPKNLRFTLNQNNLLTQNQTM